MEWEGGLDLKGPIRTPGVLHLQNPLHPFALNQLLNLLDFSLLDIETLIGCADTGDWTCLFKEIDPLNAATDNAKIREQAAQSLQHLCLLAFYLRQGLSSLAGNSSSMRADPRELAEDAQIQDLIARIVRNVSVCLKSSLLSRPADEMKCICDRMAKQPVEEESGFQLIHQGSPFEPKDENLILTHENATHTRSLVR